MATKKNQYCLTPAGSLAVGVSQDSTRFAAILPSQSHTIYVRRDFNTFRRDFCGQCTHRVTEKELKDEMKANGLLAVAAQKLKFCSDNGYCTASNAMIPTCVAGHNIQEMSALTVNTPTLLWLQDTNASAAQQIQLYAVNEEHFDISKFFDGGSDVQIKPYRLSNVYTIPRGVVSWPKKQTKPSNLRQAHTLYWNSPFTSDSQVVQPDQSISHIEHIESYHPADDPLDWNWLGNFDWFPGQEYDGVFVSTDQKIIDALPSRVVPRNTKRICGLITEADQTQWLVHINGHTFIKNGQLSGSSKLKLLR